MYRSLENLARAKERITLGSPTHSYPRCKVYWILVKPVSVGPSDGLRGFSKPQIARLLGHRLPNGSLSSTLHEGKMVSLQTQERTDAIYLGDSNARHYLGRAGAGGRCCTQTEPGKTSGLSSPSNERGETVFYIKTHHCKASKLSGWTQN